MVTNLKNQAIKDLNKLRIKAGWKCDSIHFEYRGFFNFALSRLNTKPKVEEEADVTSSRQNKIENAKLNNLVNVAISKKKIKSPKKSLSSKSAALSTPSAHQPKTSLRKQSQGQKGNELNFKFY